MLLKNDRTSKASEKKEEAVRLKITKMTRQEELKPVPEVNTKSLENVVGSNFHTMHEIYSDEYSIEHSAGQLK